MTLVTLWQSSQHDVHGAGSSFLDVRKEIGLADMRSGSSASSSRPSTIAVGSLHLCSIGRAKNYCTHLLAASVNARPTNSGPPGLAHPPKPGVPASSTSFDRLRGENSEIQSIEPGNQQQSQNFGCDPLGSDQLHFLPWRPLKNIPKRRRKPYE